MSNIRKTTIRILRPSLSIDEPMDGLDPVMRKNTWSLLLQDVVDVGRLDIAVNHAVRVCDEQAAPNNALYHFVEGLDRGTLLRHYLRWQQASGRLTFEGMVNTVNNYAEAEAAAQTALALIDGV